GSSMHPQPRTQTKKRTSVVTTGSPNNPAFPARWFYRLIARSPRRRIRLITVVHGLRLFNPVGPTSPPRTWHQLRVSGPHGFAVRFSLVRLRAGASLTEIHMDPPCNAIGARDAAASAA